MSGGQRITDGGAYELRRLKAEVKRLRDALDEIERKTTDRCVQAIAAKALNP